MDIFSCLSKLGIEYQRCDHPAVYTVEQSSRLVPYLPGAKTKNLFLRDRKGRRHWLVSVKSGKRVDLKATAPLLNTRKLSFASPERLQKYLSLEPGSVTLLGLINDHDRGVEVVIDRELWESDRIQCHPLVNTATLSLTRSDLQRFLESTGHLPQILDIPSR
ncbi:MAG: prolyl-tRNA synthetase associated domain-containing protein [Acidobacteriota bacterium]